MSSVINLALRGVASYPAISLLLIPINLGYAHEFRIMQGISSDRYDDCESRTIRRRTDQYSVFTSILRFNLQSMDKINGFSDPGIYLCRLSLR